MHQYDRGLRQSRGNRPVQPAKCDKSTCAGNGQADLGQPTNNEKAYQEGVYKKLTGLLDEPKTPLIAPPKVMRVLLLPYKNDRDLYMYRYAYFVVDDFRWVLDGNPALEGR